MTTNPGQVLEAKVKSTEARCARMESRANASDLMRFEIVTITPQDAAKMLENLAPQRTMSRAAVDRIAGDIDRGDYALTHQGVAFDHDGRLWDGQHRIAACLKANKPIQVVKVTYMELVAISMMDLIEDRGSGGGGGSEVRLDFALRTLRILRAHIQGEQLGKVYAPPRDSIVTWFHTLSR